MSATNSNNNVLHVIKSTFLNYYPIIMLATMAWFFVGAASAGMGGNSLGVQDVITMNSNTIDFLGYPELVMQRIGIAVWVKFMICTLTVIEVSLVVTLCATLVWFFFTYDVKQKWNP